MQNLLHIASRTAQNSSAIFPQLDATAQNMQNFSHAAPQNLTALTDSELYKRAQEYGLKAKQWLRKFEGLLPEIYRRKLYKRRGCASIHEFAAKLAGMSHEKTDKILRLANHLENKPALKSIFESGAASYSKIEKVVFVATPETEKAWAEKVLTVPQPALELCVQAAREKIDARFNRLEITPQSNFQPEKSTAELFELKTFSIKISAELEFELRLTKQKMEKQRGEALGYAEVLQELLKMYKAASETGSSDFAKISAQVLVQKAGQIKAKQPVKKTVQLCQKCIKEKANDTALFDATKRPIPKEVKNLVTARQQEKCAMQNCNNPPEIFHHTRRFALNQNHDPDYIVHLCVPHERLVHAGFIENEEASPHEWKIRNGSDLSAAETRKNGLSAKFRIDAKVGAYRLEHSVA